MANVQKMDRPVSRARVLQKIQELEQHVTDEAERITGAQAAISEAKARIMSANAILVTLRELLEPEIVSVPTSQVVRLGSEFPLWRHILDVLQSSGVPMTPIEIRSEIRKGNWSGKCLEASFPAAMQVCMNKGLVVRTRSGEYRVK